MAKRKFQTGLELRQVTNIDAVTAGYLGLAAKSGDFFVRTSAGVEGKVWHSANDGAGSGLDADLLDGQHWIYVHSRAQNLVSNGSALLANNTNFSAFTFDGSNSYYSNGSFKYIRGVNGGESTFTDEYIPVNPVNRYRLEMHAKSLNGTGRYYAMVACFDVDGNSVNANNHMYRANTLTTLAQPLNNGDTVMYLTSAANWDNSGTPGVNTHLRSIIIWNWVNSYGYQYPPSTYSRRWIGDAWNPGSIDYVNNTINLRVPWSGGNIPAGTQLSNGSSGSSYKYRALSNTLLTTSWVYYSGEMDGIDLTGTNAQGKFPPGTAKVKIGWLMDYQYSVIDTAWFTNVAFLLDDSPAAILAKLITVDGANSGLDADLLDGNHASAFALSGHTHNYQPLDADLTAIAALSGISGLLKKTAADTWTLDTTAYLTGTKVDSFNARTGVVTLTKADVEGVLTGLINSHTHDYSASNHIHDDRYFTEAEADNRYPILSGGLIPNAYLPSYVDDVIEVANNPSLPAQGESGKIYVTIDDNKTYRWSGSYYVEISASLALGETASTAYRGDRGKIAYDHSQILGGTGVHISDTERTNWNAAYSWGNHSGLYQLVDADLTAIAALNTTGYLRRTGAGAWQLDTTAGGDNYEGWNILVNTSLMGYIPSKNTATTYAGGLNLIAGNNISLTPASGTNNRLQITFDAYLTSNMVTLSNDVAMNTSAWTDALTISLPSSGTYWIEAKMFVSITGNTTAFFRLAIGTTYYDYTVLPSEAPTGTGTGTNTATLITLLSVAAASTLKVQYYTANAGITLKSSMTIGGVTATGLTKLGYLKIY